MNFGTMKTRLAALICAFLVAVPALAQGRDEVLPLSEIIAAVGERYHGEVVAAEVVAGNDPDLYYELRLITPAGNVLRIRIDAFTAAFIEVDGRGLVDARKPVSGQQ
ncbi:MAG: PepSY domain-containing protein [Aliihoeflea sp.]|uniref:PepSY domain-containing protein n=1 Tax=Aliihoeflea sp. TaxID=2608088 RepID=UPI004034894A